MPPEIIRRLPVRFTYDNNYFRDPYQGIPQGGYTPIIEKLLSSVSGEPYYPINNEKNTELYKKYRALADDCSWLLLGGRLAQYSYFDTDKTIRAALDLAEKELSSLYYLIS